MLLISCPAADQPLGAVVKSPPTGYVPNKLGLETSLSVTMLPPPPIAISPRGGGGGLPAAPDFSNRSFYDHQRCNMQ